MKGGYDSDDESNISRLVGGRVQEESIQVGVDSQNTELACILHVTDNVSFCVVLLQNPQS